MIGFVGMTHLGLNYSLASAAKGAEVVCYDPDRVLVGDLNRGVFPIEEPGFKDLHAKHRDMLRYTADKAALNGCTLVFYAIDVRTNSRNESDPADLNTLIEETSPELASGTTAVVMSQVRPGYMRSMIERTKTPGVSWYYQVETLIFGNAVQRAMDPERYIIGAPNPQSPLPSAYREWLGAFQCPLLVMRLESAELAKIAINFYLVSTVSTTNTLAEVCEAVGADWSEIAPALRLDRRIGPHAYLNPGLGIAGGNLERDLVTVQAISREHGTESGIIDAWQKNSIHSKDWALRAIRRELLTKGSRPIVALWGLAYKQDTHSLKNSAAIELIGKLPMCEIHAYDPVAKVQPADFANVTLQGSALEAAQGADALVIMTPWKEFATADLSLVAAAMKGRLVVDPFGVLGADACAQCGLKHFQIGHA